MTANDRTYLDNAATSWPKPESVYDAVDRYQREIGAPLGRGVYREASEVAREVQQARLGLAQLLGESEPARIVFTSSGTDSLNLAIHGLLREGDHVITTCAEHNSVLRPLRFLEDHAGVLVSRVPVDANGLANPADIRTAIQAKTKLIIAIHASNVTGTIQPVAEIGAIASEHEVLFLLDAAQTLGHLPISVAAIGCDLLAAPGHKGLLGPTGTGVLYVGPKAQSQIRPTRQGGTGTTSESDQQPNTLPEMLESGNHNVPGLVGLSAGIRFVREHDPAAIAEAERKLIGRLEERLANLPAVKLAATGVDRLGVLSLNVDGFDPQELAAMLDASASIQCRAGFHCAPLIHQAIGTADRGGTLRISVGIFNTPQQIDMTGDIIESFATSS